MAEINHALLLAGLLLFAALLLSAASNRLGVPASLVFLAVGLAATEIPGLPAKPITTDTAALIGNLALAVILLDGGLRTRLATLKMVALPALTLATAGVALTAAVVGALATALLGFDWRIGLLLGAIVGSTDAAAVFAVLGSGGTRLNERVEATLEVDTGFGKSDDGGPSAAGRGSYRASLREHLGPDALHGYPLTFTKTAGFALSRRRRDSRTDFEVGSRSTSRRSSISRRHRTCTSRRDGLALARRSVHSAAAAQSDAARPQRAGASSKFK